MQALDDEIETIHLYIVREEEEEKPFLFPVLICVILCLAVSIGLRLYVEIYPPYEHETLTIPATFLPVQTFTQEQAIIPTGIQTYPATVAYGTLTLTNGSVISQELPQGLIFT